ncbi:MAG: carbohydrate binding family 9 domain-containing protein, partial [Flavobacteriaceae bacterium]|nr:carbohydrate binding family 9 domain-containing protein [Flavobacteriaceae bacterium]
MNNKRILCILSCLISILTFAQKPLEAQVKFTAQEINIDGFENEKVWETVDEISNFWQWFPTDSLRAEQRTTAKFLFDDINLYVLVTSYSESSDYIIPSLRRDYSGAGNDNVTLILDTFMDGTNGFMFGTNPLGVKRESLISNGGNDFEKDFNKSWDVKWETEATQQDGKTISEIKIPLKSIQYPEGSTQWRMNLYRHDTHTKQWYTWANIPQNQTISGMAFMGILNFEKPLKKSGKTVALIPYVGGSVQKDFDLDEQKNILNYGGDAKLSIGSGMNLDLTINPDFSQVEVDDQVINLSRFEISLPEKRQFFIQNSDLFVNFGDRREAQPFFSRRIGVAKDTAGTTFENKIIAGVRLSGKINNNLRLGFLNMQTAEDPTNQIAGNNNTVFTLQKKVLDRSNLGFIFVNRQTTGAPDFEHRQDSFNRVVGVDFNLASKSNRWTGRTFLHQSFSPDKPKEAYASGLNLEYNARVHSVSYGVVRIGDNYQSDLGFIRRTGILKNYFRYTYRIWLKSKSLRSINLSQTFYYVGRP